MRLALLGAIVSATVLRPRTTTELVDAAFQLLRRHYTQFVSIAAVFLIPAIVLQATAMTAQRPGAVPTPGFMLAVVLVVILGLLGTAGVVVGVSDSYVRDRVDVMYAIRRVLSRFFPILGGTFATLVIMFSIMMVLGVALTFVMAGSVAVGARGAASTAAVGILVFASAALAMMAAFARIFAVPMVIVLEGASVGPAFSRSLALTEGSVWRVIGVFVLVFVIFTALFGLLFLLGSVLVTQSPRLASVFSVINGTISIFVYPIYTVFITLLYYDLRIRRDGYDLEVMTKELMGASAA
jgi:hypothetical protein